MLKRSCGLVQAIVVAAGMAAPLHASAQDAAGIANMFGGLIGAAIVQQNQQEWRRLSPDDRSCIALGLQKHGTTLQAIVNAGVPPNDERVSSIRQVCTAIASKALKHNVECSVATVDGTYTSRCDEDFSQGSDRIRTTRSEALRAAFSDDSIQTHLFERPDAVLRRQQMAASGQMSGTVPVPSFDCNKAETPLAVAICNSLVLTKLDAEYGDLYARARNGRSGALVQRLGSQLYEERKACGSDESCIRRNLEKSIDGMARVLRRRGEDVVTSLEQARRAAQAEAKQVAQQRKDAEAAERQRIEQEKHLEESKADARDLVGEASDFLKAKPNNPRILVIAKAIASLNAALENGDAGPIDDAKAALHKAVTDDTAFAEYRARRAELKSQENARFLADAMTLARQQKRFLLAYIAQNPLTPAAAMSVALVERLDGSLSQANLGQLNEVSSAVEKMLKHYGLEDNFLLSLNAVDDKTAATDSAAPPANYTITTTELNRFLLDGDAGDLVIMYTAVASAPHVLRNLKGDIVFDQGVASVCVFSKNVDQSVTQRVEAALGKYQLKQVLIDAKPCTADGTPPVDIIAVERGTFLRQDPAYASALLREIETGHVKALLTVTSAAAEASVQSSDSKRKQLEADIDHGSLDGFALAVLPATPLEPICGVTGTDGSIHAALLGRIADPATARLRTKLALTSPNIDDVFARVQRAQCGGVYASALDMKQLLDAFRREKIAFQLFPEPMLAAAVTSERDRQKEEAAQAEQESLARRRQADEARKLEDVRSGADAQNKHAQLAALHEKFGQIATSSAAALASEIKAFVNTRGDSKPGTIGAEVPTDFPGLSTWYVDQLKDGWELQSVDSELDDYGAASWKNRALEAAFSTVKIHLKNKMLGDYREGCFEVGRLVDHEFGVNRDPVDAPCETSTSIANWKAGHSFKSVWKLD